MAFDLEAGSHSIELSYVPHGAYAGIILSAVSIPAFAAIMLFSRKAGRRRTALLPEE